MAIGLTVVLPTNRIDKFLSEAVESTYAALVSTFDNEFELIIVANGVDSSRIASEIESKFSFPNLRIIDADNIGLAASLNVAIHNAKYNMIGRMDADDICELDRFDTYISCYDDSIDYYFFNAKGIDEQGDVIRNYIINNRFPISILIKCNYIHPTAIYKKDVVIKDGLYSNLDRSEDYALWLRAHFNRRNICTFNHRVLKYRFHEGQNTNFDGLIKTFRTNIKIKFSLAKEYKSYSLYLCALFDVLSYISLRIKSFRV